MLRDYTISKPATVRGYALHQMVLGLTKSGSVLFCDKGNQLIIRSEQPICDAGADIKSTYDGDIIGFELQACISKKVKGKHRYFHSRDWRSRHAWLAIEGKKHGFEPLTINSRSRMVSTIRVMVSRSRWTARRSSAFSRLLRTISSETV